MAVPKIDVKLTEEDKFAQDLEKLTLDAAYKTVPKSELQIPAFQRQGFMEKLGHTRKKWFKRFFVLRDSFLLSYNLEKSELTVEPRGCVHLAHSKIQELQHPTKICFIITSKVKWFKGFVALRDSHILLFRGGDNMSKPRGCMYLVGTEAKPIETQEKGLYGFVVKSASCGDLIELATDSEEGRTQWMTALAIGARVTYRDFKLLLKEHELLTNFKPPKPSSGPTDAEPVEVPTPAGEEKEPTEDPPQVISTPMINEETDIQGKQLDPGAVQPYTREGHPILRDPEGRWVDSKDGREIGPKDPRFSQTGQQLDSFNRPLPPGAQAMFSADGKPIGVGVDGLHYLADGTIIPQTDPHFDRDGKILPQKVVDAANGVVSGVNIAIKVRAHLAGDGAQTEAVDQLGRTFRDTNADEKGMIINADGEKVPIATARVMDRDNKEFVDIATHRQKEIKTHRDLGTIPFQERKGRLAIVVEDEETGPKEIGHIDVESGMLLSDIRHAIEEEMVKDQDFVFVTNSLPLSSGEESSKYALSVGDRIIIRSRNELSTLKAQEARVRAEQMKIYEESKKKEAEEFHNILAAIQNGTYLKPVRKFPTAE